MAGVRRGLGAHPDRKEIARYLLSRGFEQLEEEGEEAAPLRRLALAAATEKKPAFPFPAGLAPKPAPISPEPGPSRPLPRAEVVVVTWTVDEAAALAKVFTPGVSPAKWHRYSRGFQSKYVKKIRPAAPAALAKR